jgi:NADPH:quinone reductase-like Zn-dependent oxidoreductase
MKKSTMKAVVCPRYGAPEVLLIKEVDKPIPRSDEVCIKVHATAVTASDIYIRGSQLPIRTLIPMRIFIGVTKPRKSIIGLVLSGEIVAIGKEINRFQPGDQVYGITGFGLGAYAEFKCMKETDSTFGCLSLKPANITHEESTYIAYGGLLALQSIEKSNIEKGQKVLIYGASGTSGTIAVQLAKHLGAEVTGVCSTTNLELVKSLGADKVIDYTDKNSANLVERYDLVLDAVGKAKSSTLKNMCKNALSPLGKYISIDDDRLENSSKRLVKLKELTESGYIKPILDKIYPLENIIEAHEYVGKGHKKGGVAITILHT